MDKTKLISTIKLLKELNYVNRCITIEELCDIAKTCLLTTEELRKEISILLGSIDYKEFGEEEEF
ncbi:MAG: hypothetical protein MJ224_00280 [archaeon]|nr:hypothetical protein [archaeon]